MPNKLEQKELNKDMETLGLGRYRSRNESAKNRDAELETKYGQRLMRAALPAYAQSIQTWLEKVNSQRSKARYQIDLNELPEKLVAFVSIKAILDSITKKKSLASVSHYVGARIEDECRCVFLLENNEQKGGGILLGAKRRKGKSAKLRHIRSSMKKESGKKLMDPWNSWSHRDKLNCGLHLVELLRVSTNLIEYVYITDNRRSKRPTRYVTATKDTLEWIEDYNTNRELLEPFWLPTITLPDPWVNCWEGGYDTTDTSLPRLPFIKTNNMNYLRGIQGKLQEPMDAVNFIQQTPWAINDKVLDVMKHCWENSIPIGDLPSREDESLPPVPTDFETNPAANKLWRQMAARVYNHRASTISRRLLVAKILYVADKLQGNRFFYPSQVDFRGRVYNIPAFLGIQGADMSKGLLHFERPMRIKNHEQARWLAIQGANTWGNDKVTLDERVEWACKFSNTADRIACDPTKNLEWTEAEDPWQFLAWCLEWAEYAATGKVKSRLPVNMDASNNGVQILSILMRDFDGGVATNVMPTDYPHDIYQVCCDRVLELLFEDREKGNIIAGDWISFGVDRKCLKRPCMVFPYSGTFYSCRAYVDDWYQDKIRKTQKTTPFSEDMRHRATGYLSKLVWRAINEILVRPKECMTWLQHVAHAASKKKKPLQWVTPTGFPVLQDYRKTQTQNVASHIDGQATWVKWHKETSMLDPRRCKAAVSPNLVHSLDASALARTICKCSEHSIYDYAMVHDSYGTHSVNAPIMGEMLREAFIEIFSKDLLLDFKHQVEAQLPGVTLDDPPEYGSMDINEIRKSTYFFC
tara:strand:- start:14432 stop:16858 length:2427 start_codon:yes stop_codon:yes gene_type:complete